MKYTYNIIDTATEEVIHTGLSGVQAAEVMGVSVKALTSTQRRKKNKYGLKVVAIYTPNKNGYPLAEKEYRCIYDEDGHRKRLDIDLEHRWNDTMKYIKKLADRKHMRERKAG